MPFQDRPNFDVVYVPLDRTQEEWHRSVKGMPWKSLMWGERSRTAALMKRFDVRTIPFLVLLKGDCRHLSTPPCTQLASSAPTMPPVH